MAKNKFESKNVVNVPEDRMQNEQSTGTVVSANETNLQNQSKPVIAENNASGSQLKQEIAAEVITGSSTGTGSVSSAAAYGLRNGAYSGDADTRLGGAAYTPKFDKDAQGNSRVDKRISDANKEINYIGSEQYVTAFKHVDPLAVSQEEVGLNGNPANIAVRAQKASGATPAEDLYDRSVDEIRNDAVVFVMGQDVREYGVAYDDYPTKTIKLEDGQYVEVAQWENAPTRGNYMPREIKATFKKDASGHIFLSGFEVLEDNISTTEVTADVANNSATNRVIDTNNAELARQRIDSKAGSPDCPFFNPLGRSVAQPSRTLMYLRDMEASTGATMMAALRSALKARAYYLSRTAKDGQKQMSPVFDALYGHLLYSPNTSAELLTALGGTETGETYINKKYNRAGSAAILLGVFDSINKYKTKADVVNQPRGLKLPLQTGLNNHAPFKLKPEFIKAYNTVDMFSTIDRGYDPSGVTFVTDGIRLVYPYSWSKALKFTRSNFGASRTYSSEVFTYRYKAGAGQNSYIMKVADPVLNGVAWFLELHAKSIFDQIAEKDDKEVVLHIPTVHYGAHFGLWDLILCASAPYIEYERTNSLRDIIDYDKNVELAFPELVTLTEQAYRNPKNYGVISEFNRLTTGVMAPEDAIRYIFPEQITPIGTVSDNNTKYKMMPWYFSEGEYQVKAGKIVYTGEVSFSTPIIRNGVKLAYLEDFYNQDPKSVLLSLDRMTVIPGCKGDEELGAVIYKYSAGSDGLVVIADDDYKPTIAEWLSTPRQMGWFMIAPLGVCKPNANPSVTDADSSTIGLTALTNHKVLGSSSFQARLYKAANAATTTAILDKVSQVVNRGAAFVQDWYDNFAAKTTKPAGFDVALAAHEVMTFSNNTTVAASNGKTRFQPFVKTTSSAAVDTDAPYCINLMKAYWGQVQKLPFVINPFGYCVSSYHDPFEFAYMFGLAGFYAADYTEMLYNRINKYQSEMYGYTQDKYMIESPIFK